MSEPMMTMREARLLSRILRDAPPHPLTTEAMRHIDSPTRRAAERALEAQAEATLLHIREREHNRVECAHPECAVFV